MYPLLFAIILSALNTTSDLTVNIIGCKNTQGQVYIALFDSGSTFPTFGKQLEAVVLDLDSKEIKYTFKNLRHKSYAAAVYHDVNGNGVLDKNLLGMPTEPYGFSNNARNRFSAPAFSQAAFKHLNNQKITIELQ
jgi:uncharacterized protein (DUF2141 family)|tara:strand:+ start:25825 stop:26229 length:405 start_codon:yes stop_codon:yes gene_type:complete